MSLLLFVISICLIATTLLLRGASFGWYMCIFVPVISADFFGLLPSPTSDKAFYALASDVCILFLALLLYTDPGAQKGNTQGADNSEQSLSSRFGIAFFLAAYGVARNITPTLFSEPIQLLLDAQEISPILFRSYMSLLGLALLWRTHRLQKANPDR